MRWVLLLMVGAVTGVALACGGGDDEDHRGAAASAVAQFWEQERAGGVLPEGTTAQSRGTAGVVELDASDDADARICVEYRYIRAAPPFDQHTRVYVASLTPQDTWSVEVVNPDGSCEGVA